MEELLKELYKSNFFSKLNLRSEYHQIYIKTKDIPKTTFQIYKGYYEFLVISFGLTNAPSTFQSLINEVFKSCPCKFVLILFL
jgi:hypothetical protein